MRRRRDGVFLAPCAPPAAASSGVLVAAIGSALLACVSPSVAAEAPVPSPTAARGEGAAAGFLGDLPLLSSSDQPIVVESKELEFDYQQNRVFYRGDVRARQGDVTIDCDELIVVFDRADDVRRAELRAVVAMGDVVITQGERRATGGKAVFNQVDRQIVLMENPVLRDGPNEVRGDRLTVYLDEGRSVMEGGKKDRVSAVLYPGSQPQKGAVEKP